MSAALSNALVAGTVLAGPRLVLRRLELADVGDTYLGWLNDPAVNAYLETRHERQTIATVEAYVRRMLDKADECLMAICRRDGMHIGNIKVGPIHPHHKVADVSLFIGARDCWGQGFATEAIGLASGHAFRTLGVEKLSAGMYAPNVASTKAFLRAGFKIEGTREKHYQLAGARCDILLLGLTRDAWRDRAAQRS